MVMPRMGESIMEGTVLKWLKRVGDTDYPLLDRIKALGVSGLKRATAAPDIPTIAEQGFPEYDIHAWYGLLVRAGTPAPRVEQLYEAVRTALASSDSSGGPTAPS